MIVIPYEARLFGAYCEAMQFNKAEVMKLLKDYKYTSPSKRNSERMLLGKLYLQVQELKELKELNEYIENLQSKILDQQKTICEYEQMIEAAETLVS